MEATKKIGIWGFDTHLVFNNAHLISNKRHFDDLVIESLETFLETKHILLGVQA